MPELQATRGTHVYETQTYMFQFDKLLARVTYDHRIHGVRKALLSVCTAVFAYTVPVAAHAGGGAETGVPFWLLLVSSAGGGLVGGVVLARIGRRLLSRWTNHLEQGIHVLVLLIGLTLVVPPLVALSTSGMVGTLIGSSLAGTAIVVTGRREANGLLAVATGGVGVHRAVEGFALAAAYLSGAAIGVLSALALTAHAAFEIAVIYSGELEASPRTALMRGVGIQSILIVSGTFGILTGSLPDIVRSVVVTVAGGALVVVGARGITARRAADSES